MSHVKISHLRGIVMRAPNITQTKEFYQNLWGLETDLSDDDTIYFHGTGSEPFIYGIKDSDVYGIEYIHFGLEDRATMDEFFESLQPKNVKILGRPAVFSDIIGGYGFEILDLENRRYRFTTDVQKRPSKDTFAHARKISHVVLNSAIIDDMVQFLQDVLGFRISDYSADQMVFMRCSNDHHSIALVRGQYPSVNHVAFEMPDLDSFMRGIGRMKQMGHHPSWGPGRHGPGNNPFAYFVSPSGFVIEFTAELQQIDEATHQPKVWSREDPESMDRWMTAGPPTTAQRAVMQGRPDPGFPTPSN